MLCKLQYGRINNITKIMCLKKKDYTFFWRLVYTHVLCRILRQHETLTKWNFLARDITLLNLKVCLEVESTAHWANNILFVRPCISAIYFSYYDVSQQCFWYAFPTIIISKIHFRKTEPLNSSSGVFVKQCV